MRRLLPTLLVPLLGCAGSAPAVAAPETPPAAASAARRDIDVATLRAELDAGRVPLLVDVRSPEEFAQGRVPGARNIPLDTLLAQLEALGPADREVVLICAVGGRSAEASRMLLVKGRKPVNVLGGTQAWVSAHYPLER
jgi:rhodanese-related sulfurtransferase